MNPRYAPIDCGLYDHLELHAMRGTPLDVDYLTPDGAPVRLSRVRLITIRQTSGEELGVFRGEGRQEVAVRLDRLRILTDRGTGRYLDLGGHGSAGAAKDPAGEEPTPLTDPGVAR